MFEVIKMEKVEKHFWGRTQKVVYDALKGIDSKLGFTDKPYTDTKLIQKIPEVKILKGYQYPHQYEQLKKFYNDEFLPAKEKARAEARKLLY
jgi:predicted membrane-bound dolichyl-phosphate-mannose-protein mannosyltransferase